MDENSNRIGENVDCDSLCAVQDWVAGIASIPIEMVPISSLHTGDSPRTNRAISEDHVRALAEIADALPPIIVHRQTMSVIDGSHRLQAALRRDADTIAVRYFDGNSHGAYAVAVHANVAHGLPLSLPERKSAAARLIEVFPGWSDRRIAMMAGLSHRTVSAIRRCATGQDVQSNSRVGVDGKVRPLRTLDGRRKAAELIAANPGASLREIAKAAGISPGTVKSVRDDLLGRTNCSTLRASSLNDGEEALEISSTDAVKRLPTMTREGAPTPIQHAILKSLSTDPALRFTDRGKALLRCVSQSVSGIDNWEKAVVGAPEHCIDQLTRLAMANAQAWKDLAGQFKDRDRSDGEPRLRPEAGAQPA